MDSWSAIWERWLRGLATNIICSFGGGQRELLVVVIGSMSVAAGHAHYVQGSPGYGRDLEGVWDFSMLTPLQRPANYRETRDLTADEAAVFARSLREANTERQQQATRAGVIAVGVDEEIWFERGSLASINGRFPTSLIVEPPDGQMPALTAQAAARIAERRRLSARLDSAQDRALNERCLRAVSGPPYLPSSDGQYAPYRPVPGQRRAHRGEI